MTSISLQAQSQPLSVDEIISVALQNNPSIKAAKLKVDQSEALKKSAVNFGNTNFGYNYGQINSEMMDYSFEVNQSFKFPTTYSSTSKYRKEEVKLSEINKKISKSELGFTN